MKLNLEKLLKHTGNSKDEFAKNVGISVDTLDQYSHGEMGERYFKDLLKMMKYSGLSDDEITDDEELSKSKTEYSPLNTWVSSQNARLVLESYMREGEPLFEDESVLRELNYMKQRIDKWKKPKISFAGQANAGKSTLINSLLGDECMPTDSIPLTSIAVHIKHKDDRPSFMNEDVWIFGKSNGELWDEEKYNDKEYCEKFLLQKGDCSLLKTYGVHNDDLTVQEYADQALVFLDSPFLCNCDILDLPGFGGPEEDAAIQKFNIQDKPTDILIYLSLANSFLLDRDLEYLITCIDALKPIEKPDGTISKLSTPEPPTK